MRRSVESIAVLLMVTSAVVAVLGNEAVAAPGDRECQIVDRKLVCETDDGGGPAAPPTDEVNDGGSGARPTAYWTIVLVPEQMGNGDATAPCLDPNGQPGRTYRYTLRDSATGATLETFTRCVATAEPASVIETPPSDPPTAAELLGAAPIPEPAILTNPGGRGLTGLETRFWAADPGPVTVSVTIRGWNVTGTLNAQQWTWTTGDGGRYEATNPGSPEHPAARHIYDTKDTWPVALQVSWSGSYTVSGFGTTYTVTGLATTGSSTLDYDVIEVRGVIDEPQPAASP